MKNTLLSLQTRRSALTIIIADLQIDRVDANKDRTEEIDKELSQYQAKLKSIILDIPILSVEVGSLDEQWKKKNVFINR
jgi:hypothetical protein